MESRPDGDGAQDPAHLEFWAEQGFRAHVLHTGLNEVPLRSLLTSGYQNLLFYRVASTTGMGFRAQALSRSRFPAFERSILRAIVSR